MSEGFIQWHCVVLCIWRALFVTSQFYVIVLFPNQRFGEVCWHNMHIFLYIHSPMLCVIALNIILLALQIRQSEESTPNATIQQYVTAKISGCTLKQGSTTHSSIRQNNLQRKNEAAPMSCRIRAVEHRKYVGGLAGAHQKSDLAKLHNNWECYTRLHKNGENKGWKIESCLTTQELRMPIKYARKLSILLLFIEVQQTFSFPLFLLRHNNCLNASMLTIAAFELVDQFYNATEIGRPNAANAVGACADQP